jgi:hypothetical protein
VRALSAGDRAAGILIGKVAAHACVTRDKLLRLIRVTVRTR